MTHVLLVGGKNFEHLALLKSTRALTSAVAADPLAVAEKLFEKGLASSAQLRAAQLQTKDDHLKASELVVHIVDTVEYNPEQYKVVLGILKKFTWLQDAVKAVEKIHDDESHRARATDFISFVEMQLEVV